MADPISIKDTDSRIKQPSLKKHGAETNFQECMTPFWGQMFKRSVTSELGSQSPEEGCMIVQNLRCVANYVLRS